MARLSHRDLSVTQLRQRAGAGKVFAVLDACDTPEVPRRLRALGEERAVSLYRGRAEEELWGIAPYLARLDVELLDWITHSLWSEPWGIIALAEAELEELRRHFRRFLVVESPAGEPWYFRFYDPRVLPAFLGACRDDELADLFGPVHAFGITDPASYGVRLFLNQVPAAEAAERPSAIKVVRR